jgi:hypothetical protein
MKKFLIGSLIVLSLAATGCATPAKDADGNRSMASTEVVVVDTPQGEVTCIVVFEIAGTEPHGIDCSW